MQSNARPNRSYTNVILTVIAGLLGVIAFERGADPVTPVALAQVAGDDEPSREDPTGRISAAEQRKIMISELKNLGARIERLESMIAKGLTVKVTEMPVVRMQDKGEKP